MSDIILLEKHNLYNCANAFLNKIITNPNYISSWKHWCLRGEADQHWIRSSSWKYFLGWFRNEICSWIDAVASIRAEYKVKFKRFCSIQKLSGDPWGSNKPAPKKKKDEKLEAETELKRWINLDLSRTYQEIDRFTKHNAKTILANVLFIWSKENKDISYKQGMNELLAGLYLAWYPYYFTSTTKPKPSPEHIKQCLENPNRLNIADIYIYFNDEDEIQSDLFFLFDTLMKKGMKEWFIPDIIKDNASSEYNKYELFPKQIKDNIDEDVPTYINRRCALLIKEKLRNVDEELFNHFRKIELTCSVFLQRWIRCMFNHEFDFREVLLWWDAIFANQNQSLDRYDLIFIDYLAIAMIIRIRNELFMNDQNGCFSKLFKYPKDDNVVELINLGERVQKAMNECIKYNRKGCVYQILGTALPITPASIPSDENNDMKSIQNNKSNKGTTEGKGEIWKDFDHLNFGDYSTNTLCFWGIGPAFNSLDNFNCFIEEIKEIGTKVKTTLCEQLENFTSENQGKSSRLCEGGDKRINKNEYRQCSNENGHQDQSIDDAIKTGDKKSDRSNSQWNFTHENNIKIRRDSS